MQTLAFLTIFCFTATAEILPPGPPDLSDLLEPPSPGTVEPDNSLEYNGLPTFTFDSPSNSLMSPVPSDRDVGGKSSHLVDTDELGSTSIASADLADPEIPTFNSETANFNGGEASLINNPNPDSDRISSTDGSFINSVALADTITSSRKCRPGKLASNGKGLDIAQSCPDMSTLMRYQIKLDTADAGSYSEEEIHTKNGLWWIDEQWRRENEPKGFPREYDNEGWDLCEREPNNRQLPFCSMGPYQWLKDGQPVTMKPRRKDKRSDYTLNVGNSVLYYPGRPRCKNLTWQYCCIKYGAKMRWGFWGINCVLMNP